MSEFDGEAFEVEGDLVFGGLLFELRPGRVKCSRDSIGNGASED